MNVARPETDLCTPEDNHHHIGELNDPDNLSFSPLSFFKVNEATYWRWPIWPIIDAISFSNRSKFSPKRSLKWRLSVRFVKKKRWACYANSIPFFSRFSTKKRVIGESCKLIIFPLGRARGISEISLLNHVSILSIVASLRFQTNSRVESKERKERKKPFSTLKKRERESRRVHGNAPRHGKRGGWLVSLGKEKNDYVKMNFLWQSLRQLN